MRKKAITQKLHDYNEFTSPYTAIAVMIFAQAATDLKTLGGRDRTYIDGILLSKWEIVNFLRSPWAGFLAGALDISDKELKALERKAIGV